MKRTGPTVRFVSVAAVAIQDRRHVQYQGTRRAKFVPVVYWVDSDGDRWMTDEAGDDVLFDPVDKRKKPHRKKR